MATIRQFQDLLAWQRARELAQFVYEITGKPGFAGDPGLKQQLRNASESAMSNTAEGFDRGGAAQSHQFLSIAKASATEVSSQLFTAFDRRHISQPDLEEGLRLASETTRLLGGFMRYLRTCGLRGRKYRGSAGSRETPDPGRRTPDSQLNSQPPTPPFS